MSLRLLPGQTKTLSDLVEIEGRELHRGTAGPYVALRQHSTLITGNALVDQPGGRASVQSVARRARETPRLLNTADRMVAPASQRLDGGRCVAEPLINES
jgi:hypothetical protein